MHRPWYIMSMVHEHTNTQNDQISHFSAIVLATIHSTKSGSVCHGFWWSKRHGSNISSEVWRQNLRSCTPSAKWLLPLVRLRSRSEWLPRPCENHNSKMEKAFKLLRELPKVALNNVRPLPGTRHKVCQENSRVCNALSIANRDECLTLIGKSSFYRSL